MELVVVLVALLLVIGLVVGYVVLRRRGPELEVEAPERVGRAPAPPEAEEYVETPTAEVELIEPAVLEAPEVEAPQAPVEEVVEAPAVKPSFRDRLSKARGALSGYVSAIRSRGIDDETWDDLEEALIRADVGVSTTTRLLDAVRTRVQEEKITDSDQLLSVVKEQLVAELGGADRSLRYASAPPTVWLFVGVNGVGKTTTIGKLGRRAASDGHKVVMAAADTFRAAAAEQLELWAERAGAELVRGNEGGDPAAVVFDAIAAADARSADLVLADTAGRLHTKTNLMEELRKVRRVADKGAGEVTETLLVIDATTGQNGLVQAREFAAAVDVTGVVLTKLDGSAKGGIVLAIQADLGIPVKLVGLGEGLEDLVDFDGPEFVDALFE